MSLLIGEQITGTVTRRYTIHVPDNPGAAVVPAIVVFHGGGQDAANIALRWGVDPPNPVPLYLANYLLVFPESDPRLADQWVHFRAGDSAFPTLDLEFVRQLLLELTTRNYDTAVAGVYVNADPEKVYAAGFSNGGGMVWQLLNSGLSSEFRGYAAVGKALDPEKVRHYQNQLPAGTSPAPAPVAYVHGTADRTYRPPFSLEETPLDMTLPAFTMREMLTRNGIPANVPAATQLIPGSTGVTEVVVQLFQGGTEAFLMATVVNGGHNWPTPTTVGNPPVAEHFDATEAIVRFWRLHAGL